MGNRTVGIPDTLIAVLNVTPSGRIEMQFFLAKISKKE